MNIVESGKKLQDWMASRFLGHPVVFHHVPKCAGTSVARALRMRYFPSQQGIVSAPSYYAAKAFCDEGDREALVAAMMDLREQILLYHLHCNVRCIAAHVRFSERAYAGFADRYKFVTILREPVSRFISHYFWDFGRPQEWAEIDLPLEAFLDTSHAARLGTLFGEFYSGLPMGSDFASDRAVEAAKRNLERFAAVGFVEDMPAFRRAIRSQLGVAVDIRHQNKGKVQAGDRKRVVTPELRRRIEQLCAPDVEIYRHGRRLFGEADRTAA